MTNFLNRLRDGLRGGKATPEADNREAADPESTGAEPGGIDARRLAERKADAAGRKWREAAEARGEVARETGGPQGLEPTRYGDWERTGRCVDF